MRRSILYIVPVIVIALIGILSSVFVVDERQKALVLQFGQIRQVREDPGIGFKIPLIQQVVTYDDRILSLDTETFEVTPADDRRLVVDAFARYRIADVVRFRQAVGTGGERQAEARLESILNSQIREVLGADQVTSDVILSSDRRLLMNRIRDQAQSQAADLGLDVIDVRLKQTNLPSQNLEATFERMRAERQREAEDERARGEEAAQRVRALADRTVTETLSEAQRERNVTRGEADARANAIFAEAYGADPEFFDFYRSLQAYRLALQGNNSTMVMTPDNAFFDYLYSQNAPENALPSGPIDLPPEVAEEAAAAQAEVEPVEVEAGGPETPEAVEEDAAEDAAGDDGSAQDLEVQLPAGATDPTPVPNDAPMDIRTPDGSTPPAEGAADEAVDGAVSQPDDAEDATTQAPEDEAQP
ncbi:protease modulator HflC [Pseudoroseicyclus aestuarii]|uniref:Protease FtsH subunit HflC n=1 Tax=Pseudoroseicyclus aestuarii TaxID=1795041 RepID=A0A318SVU9_9RHOB|nr:protease modulator HflC [Pseudoroseicyclus aestuarii]PYE85622.1 protease FtsH subunit HflC [Pseudoroseicyclus aestuarii]